MNKIREKLIEQLRQGVSAEALSLALVLGLILGTIPILGSTTLLCAGAAIFLRLNQPLIQLINYFVYPLQLLLYVPLLMQGARMLDPALATLTLAAIFDMFRVNLWQAIQSLFWANLGAVLIWGAVAVPLGMLLYAVLLRLMRNFHKTLPTTS